MQHAGNIGDLAWREALANAARRLPGEPAGALLFLENRQDLTLELRAGEERPACMVTRTSGLAARGAFGSGRAVFRSDPELADASRLVAALTAPVGGTEFEDRDPDRRSTAAGADQLPRPESLEILRAAVGETEKLHPSAEVHGRWIEFDQQVRIGRPGGEVAEDRRRGGRIRLETRVVVGDRPVASVGEAVGLDLDPDAVRALAGRVVERLAAQARARPVTPGRHPVVLAPGVGGILVHELVGHALEGDVGFARGSWLARCAEGTPVAASELSVIDDPRRGRGAWRLDDEGTPARPTALIRSGALAGCLFDLESAHRSNRRSTGHGRRSGYREPVLPRMGCTFVAAGRYRPEQILDGVDDGVYVRRMEAANTDPRSGLAVFRVTDADRIRHGKLESPLRPHLLRVKGRETLLGIDRIGNDLEFDCCVGSCVRDGQPLSISVGAPTIRIGMVNVLS